MYARIYVIYGQGGVLTSFGMFRLAERIRAMFPDCQVTTHPWKYPDNIVNDIPRGPKGPKIVIGYSLGANAVTWVAAATTATINLAVCYDPSVLSLVKPIGSNVKRLLLYHNNSREPEGHALLAGPQVERTEVSQWHLAVCYNEELHQKTLAAIGKVVGAPVLW